MPRARCGVQLKSYLPGLRPAKDTVYVSLGAVRSGLLKSPIFALGPAPVCPGMFDASCFALAESAPSAGSVLNATLCGPPVTFVNLTPSPTLMESVAGSKRYPFASPIILTSHVLPVMGAGVPAVAAAVGAAAPAAGAGAAAAAAVESGVLVLAFLSPPPPHAPSAMTPAVSTTPWNRILSSLPESRIRVDRSVHLPVGE